MAHFVKDNKLSKLIHSNHFLLPVINRFGIRLGFGDKTVEEVCIEKSLDVDFFLSIVNTFSNKDYFPQKELLAFSPLLIVEYLRKTHAYYFDYLLPEIERRMQVLILNCSEQCNNLELIKSFYEKYKTELRKHIEIEEQHVFPYIKALVTAYKKKEPIHADFTNYSILNYEKEHTDIEQKIYDLKNIIIKYLEPSYNDNDCNSFLFSLFQLEQDIQDHARIEDNILVAKVVDIEKVIQHG